MLLWKKKSCQNVFVTVMRHLCQPSWHNKACLSTSFRLHFYFLLSFNFINEFFARFVRSSFSIHHTSPNQTLLYIWIVHDYRFSIQWIELSANTLVVFIYSLLPVIKYFYVRHFYIKVPRRDFVQIFTFIDRFTAYFYIKGFSKNLFRYQRL